jgi:hypothetical protein
MNYFIEKKTYWKVTINGLKKLKCLKIYADAGLIIFWDYKTRNTHTRNMADKELNFFGKTKQEALNNTIEYIKEICK